MKKILGLIAVLLFFALPGNAIRVHFTAFNMSVNVANGTTGVYTFYEIYPDNYVIQDTTDSTELVDFPQIAYGDVSQILIERTLLSDPNQVFTPVAAFNATTAIEAGDFADMDIVAGEVYAYRLSVVTNLDVRFDLLLKTAATESAAPNMNCAKLNNVYRKACHNCFQDNMIKAKHGGLYTAMFATRVIELDIHANSGDSTRWTVAHTGAEKNNCGWIAPGIASGNKHLSGCLADVQAWHVNNPGHDLIIVHLDLKDEFNTSVDNSPVRLDEDLAAMFGSANIYKPSDLGGSSDDPRTAANTNNWPSLGDLTNKLMFVLTGHVNPLNIYMSNRTVNAMAFCAISVTDMGDQEHLAGVLYSSKKYVVCYNLCHSNPYIPNANMNIAINTSGNGYINRSWRTNTGGQPGPYTDAEYRQALDFKINNVAVGKDFRDRRYPATYSGQNGIKHSPSPASDNAVLVTDHIYSSYANVTQSATQTIQATNLVVEPGAHYRMMAGDNITLNEGTDIRPGANADIRIEDCSDPLFWALAKQSKTWTPEMIDEKVEELSSRLYQGQGVSMSGVKVFPNPVSNALSIRYASQTTAPALFRLTDVMGKTVKSFTYMPPAKGGQSFSVDVGDLPAAVYFYTLQSGNDRYNGKVVKTGQ